MSAGGSGDTPGPGTVEPAAGPSIFSTTVAMTLTAAGEEVPPDVDPVSGATHPTTDSTAWSGLLRLTAAAARATGSIKAMASLAVARNLRTVRMSKSPRRARLRAAVQLAAMLGALLSGLLLLLQLMMGAHGGAGRVPFLGSVAMWRGNAAAAATSTLGVLPPPPALTIVAIVQRPDTGAMERLVRSLSAADYDGDVIDLALWVDLHTASVDEVASIGTSAAAALAGWSHGAVSLRHSTAATGPYDTHMHAVSAMDGMTARGQVLYVDDATEVAPSFYTWLRDARRSYGERPDVAGYSLESARVVRRGGSLGWEALPAEDAGTGSFLYQALPGVGAFSPQEYRDVAVWSTFADWLSARANSWYTFPVAPQHLVEPAPLFQGGNGTRAHWSAWFSVFARDYNLYVVYPPTTMEGTLAVGHRSGARRTAMLTAVGATAATPTTNVLRTAASGPASVPTAPLRWTVNGLPANEIDGGGGIVDGHALLSQTKVDEMVATAQAAGGVLSMTVVNEVFLETAHSWLCNVDGGGFRPANVVWATTDKVSRDALSRVAGTSTVYLDEMRGGKSTGHDFGNPGYWRLMLERTALLSALVHRGVRVFAFETDQVWLEDPTPYITARLGDGADVVGTINTREEISGNFFYLRPSLPTRRLFDEIVRRFAAAYTGARLDKQAATSWTYIENDQSILTKLVLRNQTFQTAYPVRFETLDQERFVDGRWYNPEEGFYASAVARQPVVINNNFIIGVEKKALRAKQWGHWFLRDDGTCDSAVVAKAVRSTAAAAEAVARDQERAAGTLSR